MRRRREKKKKREREEKVLSNQFEPLIHLIDPSIDLVVQNEGDQQALDLNGCDVQFLGDEGDLNSGVRLDQLDQDLGPDVLEQLFNVVTNERVVHDGLPVV